MVTLGRPTKPFMETMSDTEQLHVKVDSDVKRKAKAKLPHGGLSEKIRETLRTVADGDAERFNLREELTELRDTREELKQERDAIERKLSDIERKIERKEEKLEKYTDPESEYKGYVESLADQIENDEMHFDPQHGTIEKKAPMYGKSKREMLSDLEEAVSEDYERYVHFEEFVKSVR